MGEGKDDGQSAIGRRSDFSTPLCKAKLEDNDDDIACEAELHNMTLKRLVSDPAYTDGSTTVEDDLLHINRHPHNNYGVHGTGKTAVPPTLPANKVAGTGHPRKLSSMICPLFHSPSAINPKSYRITPRP
jgi:hypothetical protein